MAGFSSVGLDIPADLGKIEYRGKQDIREGGAAQTQWTCLDLTGGEGGQDDFFVSV